MSEPLTVEDLLRVGTRVLSDSTAIFEDHDNEDEARELLALTLGIDDDDLDDDHEPARRQREKYLSLVARRAAGEPMPFLRGFIDFYGLELRVRPGAFVPRPSSELTVDRALKRLGRRRNPIVVDVCAGVGPIGMAVASERSDADVWALDISEEGCKQGRANARRLGVKNISFGSGDMYEPLPTKYHGEVDMIVAHVPYIPADEVDDLPDEVKVYEPMDTLTDSSHDGLFLMRRAVSEGAELMKPGGWLLLEMSDDMASKAKRLYQRAGFRDVSTVTDEDELSVVVEGRKSPS
ncbi:MAG: peptide chain release factor N(5)-glutamine methyltransferase [Actinobacteria bacterium]|nr:peptide chain release factor N(5)-glutamine methyltransferase [Actinomycetota bacterium]